MKNIDKIAKIINGNSYENAEFYGCYAVVEDKKITITLWGKKSDKIFIENGIVTKKGYWQVEMIADKIVDKFNLVKNY
jgi:hypothetical protein